MIHKNILLTALFFATSSFTIANAETTYQYNSDGSSSYTINPGTGTTYQYNSNGSSSYTIDPGTGTTYQYNSDGSSSYTIDPYRR